VRGEAGIGVMYAPTLAEVMVSMGCQHVLKHDLLRDTWTCLLCGFTESPEELADKRGYRADDVRNKAID
jgi:hypothetical protein